MYVCALCIAMYVSYPIGLDGIEILMLAISYTIFIVVFNACRLLSCLILRNDFGFTTNWLSMARYVHTYI